MSAPRVSLGSISLEALEQMRRLCNGAADPLAGHLPTLDWLIDQARKPDEARVEWSVPEAVDA